MDGKQFDQLTRSLATSSRRGFVRAAAGALASVALAALHVENGAAASRRQIGQICRKHSDCAGNICSPADATGRRRCGCASPADCPAPANLCLQAACLPDGTCGSEPRTCDDNNRCTVDSCDPVKGCIHTPRNCDDNNACTVDSCNPAIGCVNTPISCDDNNPCTIDSCDPVRGCVHTPKICDDGNPCTIDICDSQTGQCVHTPIDCD